MNQQSNKEPITVYFSDNQSAEIYKLTSAQLRRLAEDDDWETAEKFKITNLPHGDGYIPDYLVELAAIYGFELGIGDIGECVGFSEIDKYAIQTYERNFNGHRNFGDATKIDERELPDFNLLVGGFPCQAFSVAGKRQGFDDTRGTLFFDIARILAHKRPRHHRPHTIY